jgi:hypothetical protein
MKNLSRGNDANSAKVATLILSSAPVLLPYLFTDEKKALNFLVNAAQREHGQYSAALRVTILHTAPIVMRHNLK